MILVVLVCALAPLACSYLFVHYGVASLLYWSQADCLSFASWLPILVILIAAFATLVVLWIVSLSNEQKDHFSSKCR